MRRQVVKQLRRLSNVQQKLKSGQLSTGVNGREMVKNDKLQFSKGNLNEFGDLGYGQVPESLKYTREQQSSQLDNGVRVVSEEVAGQLVAVNLTIKTGSRDETLETSGVNQMLKSLVTRGTSTMSRQQVEDQLALLGGNLEVKVDREYTQYTLTVEKSMYLQGVEYLLTVVGDMAITDQQVEAEKQGVFMQSVHLAKDQYLQTMESAHACSYRDHFMGQPLFGIRENIHLLTADMIKQYKANHYTGDKTVVSVAGQGVDHQQVQEVVNNKLKGWLKHSAQPLHNQHQAQFTPSTMFIRDDEMNNINVGCFFKAPSYDSNEHFQLKLLQKVLGEYQADKYTGRWLNSPDKQYSVMHSQLGMFPDITLHKCDYFTYSDSALFGSYLMGNEVFSAQLQYMSQFVLTEYANHLSNAELVRAKNQLFTQLLQEQLSAKKTAEQSGLQTLYFNRRVSATEQAYRYAAVEPEVLQRTVSRCFYDKDLTLTVWGPVGHSLGASIYRRDVQRSSLGWLGASHYSAM